MFSDIAEYQTAQRNVNTTSEELTVFFNLASICLGRFTAGYNCTTIVG